MKYEPYNFDALHNLMYRAYLLGNYGGIQDLITVKMQGTFEGWSGRATEAWEHQFVVTYRNPQTESVITKTGRSLQEACSYILGELDENWRDRCVYCFRMCDNQVVLKEHIKRNHMEKL